MVVRGDFGWEPWADQFVGRERVVTLNVAQPPDLGGIFDYCQRHASSFSPETFFRFLLLYLQVNEKTSAEISLAGDGAGFRV